MFDEKHCVTWHQYLGNKYITKVQFCFEQIIAPLEDIVDWYSPLFYLQQPILCGLIIARRRESSVGPRVQTAVAVFLGNARRGQ